MCLGGGPTKVTQTPAPKSPEEIEAIKLALESLRLRNKFLPALMQSFGYGQDAGGNLAQLPRTAFQQSQDRLAQTGITGAQDAAGVIRSRLEQAQGLIPGLMQSVRASMAPGTRPPMLPSLPSTAGLSPTEPPPPLFPTLPPVAPGGTSGGTSTTGPSGNLLNQTRVAAITGLYQSLLGRAPDPQGLDSWLNSDKSLDQIRLDIMNSPEYLARQR